ncbi:MAG: 50S ribosomal protein L3 [Chloroflexi bacterium]|nr:50S ribosomal protein L3 [Chloroflexota bacterium]
MIRGLLGRKLGMTRAFDENGVSVALTLVQAGPCWVTQVRTPERDGYSAAQIGYEETKRLNRPQQGHLKNVPKLRHLREVPIEDGATVAVGTKFDVSLLKPGDLVDVVGTSKGRGFAGVVKRHGFAGGPKTHGQSDRHRAPGSIGSGTTPGRVVKGLRMAGRMGGERVTVRNLRVMQVDPERNLVALKGAVPGARNGLLLIRKSRGTP